MLASQFGDAVDIQRSWGIVLDVGAPFAAVKNIVGADMHENRARLPRHHGKVSGSERVDRECLLGLALAGLDVVHRRRVDDELGPEVSERSRDRIEVSDFDVRVGQLGDIVAVRREGGDHVATELSIGANDHKFHAQATLAMAGISIP